MFEVDTRHKGCLPLQGVLLLRRSIGSFSSIDSCTICLHIEWIEVQLDPSFRGYALAQQWLRMTLKHWTLSGFRFRFH